MVRLSGKSVFLSGPMSGLPHYNVEAFAKAHAIVKEAGASLVYDPAIEYLQSRADEEGHEYWMRHCLHVLTKTDMSYVDGEVKETRLYDVLVLLPGWMESAGAQLECAVAAACGIEVHELSGVEHDV